MASKNEIPHIPYDIYQSPQEIVIVLPLWWVDKKTIELGVKNYRLVISWKRTKPEFKGNLIPLKEECYRGEISQTIELPPEVYFEKIHSKLSPDNILTIIVPKALIPERIKLEVEYDK